MTVFGHDASHWDWERRDLNLAAEHRAGIDMFTYKATEGTTWTDGVLSATMIDARQVGFAVMGTYHFLWPGNAAAQADHWFAKVSEFAPWWRDHPCWIWQVDAEVTSAGTHPTVHDINACGDRIVHHTGCAPTQVAVYAPHWLYGGKPRPSRSDLAGTRKLVLDAEFDTARGVWVVRAAAQALAASGGLAGLRYPILWASGYGNNPAIGFKKAYAAQGGDHSGNWAAYDGMHPSILQFGSRTTIAGQPTCDANAIRVPNRAALQALFLGDDMDEAQFTEFLTAALKNNTVRRELCGAVTNTDNVVKAPKPPADPKGNQYWELSSIVRGGYNQTRNAVVGIAKNNAKQAAILEAVKGAATLAQLDAALDEFEKELAGSLAQALTDAVAARLGDVDHDVIQDACEDAVRDVLGSVDDTTE